MRRVEAQEEPMREKNKESRKAMRKALWKLQANYREGGKLESQQVFRKMAEEAQGGILGFNSSFRTKSWEYNGMVAYILDWTASDQKKKK